MSFFNDTTYYKNILLSSKSLSTSLKFAIAYPSFALYYITFFARFIMSVFGRHIIKKNVIGVHSTGEKLEHLTTLL